MSSLKNEQSELSGLKRAACVERPLPVQQCAMTAMYNRAVFFCCGAWIACCRSSLNALNDALNDISA